MSTADPAVAMNVVNHPVFARLTTEQASPFARHTVLHELEQRVATSPRKRALRAKVKAFVERGVPYFAPGDSHYRDWAAQVAVLWQQAETA
jgi:hypothetical protein